MATPQPHNTLHPTLHPPPRPPVLAVASDDGYVAFVNMDGALLAKQMFHVGPVLRLALQPSLKLPDFAVGLSLHHSSTPLTPPSQRSSMRRRW